MKKEFLSYFPLQLNLNAHYVAKKKNLAIFRIAIECPPSCEKKKILPYFALQLSAHHLAKKENLGRYRNSLTQLNDNAREQISQIDMHLSGFQRKSFFSLVSAKSSLSQQ